MCEELFNKAQPLRRKGTPTSRTFVKVCVVLCQVICLAGPPSHAQQTATSFLPVRYAPPDVILVPLPEPQLGWRLTYRNRLQGADAADTETETRTIRVRGTDDTHVASTISWRLTRTPNAECLAETGTPCPDKLEILTVPDGFAAFPKSMWVREGAGMEVFIVPNGIG